MKTSYKKTFLFQALAAAYISENKEESLFKDALYEINDQIEPVAIEFNRIKIKKQRRHALRDPKTTALFKDEYGNFRYSEDGENALDDEVNEIYEDEDLVYLKHEYVDAELIPKDLAREYRKAFTGFVIAPKQGEEIQTTAQKLISKTK